MEGLIEAGFCMLDFGNSNPASGAEHHMSHYWEMKLLREGRPAIFHGTKVGVASVLSAQWYAQLRKMDQRQVSAVLKGVVLPDPGEVEKQLREVYGPVAEDIIVEQAPYIHMSDHAFDDLKDRIINRWEDILELANGLPAPAQWSEWLAKSGAPTTGQQIGLDDGEIELGKNYGHFLRKRYTIGKLRLLLGLR